MAFDMYQDGLHDRIDHHEEYLIDVAASRPKTFPQLAWLQDEFYSDPVLSPDRANALVHEFIELIDLVKDERKSATDTIFRLIRFLSAAVRENRDIRCNSD